MADFRTQSQVSGMRQSTETSWFTNQGYNSSNNLFACPAGASRQVWPWDTTIGEDSESVSILKKLRKLWLIIYISKG